MYNVIIQEIKEDGTIINHREIEAKRPDEFRLQFWERYYSRSIDTYDYCSYNSDAVVINVFECD